MSYRLAAARYKRSGYTKLVINADGARSTCE